MWIIVISLILLALAMTGAYEWGKCGEKFNEKMAVVLMFISGVAFTAYAGYDLGTGHPAKASEILSKGEVYSVEAQIKRGNEIYATVTNRYGNVYPVIFDENKPPPPKFKVVEDKNGQVYIAVP